MESHIFYNNQLGLFALASDLLWLAFFQHSVLTFFNKHTTLAAILLHFLYLTKCCKVTL